MAAFLDTLASGTTTPNPFLALGFSSEETGGETGAFTPVEVAGNQVDSGDNFSKLHATHLQATLQAWLDSGEQQSLSYQGFCEKELPGGMLEQVKMPAPPKPHPVKFLSEVVISRGSIGHPVSCAAPCRYVKRKEGCRDGANCPNCHECFWTKASGRDANDAQQTQLQAKSSDMQKSTKSVGTLGHPYRCGEPCKHFKRKGGCMHGPRCLNCHECHWQRKPKTLRMDAINDDFDFALGGKGSNTSAGLPVPVQVPEPQPPLRDTAPSYAFLPSPDILHAIPYFDADGLDSAGSIGHPFTCAPACKYQQKPKGCKDGAACLRCHKCRWNKDGMKTFSL
eukprot:TRINITY_DN6038_c0_g2_i1.p1 TRINITY_DN6038_c0_g2~~TRINITY_DN6038_c0_g2_i1.p1  ORF type:complete len:337 (-),score=62.42 TRINITY_DN6038_c0_g2_i1:36-1046(-)